MQLLDRIIAFYWRRSMLAMFIRWSPPWLLVHVTGHPAPRIFEASFRHSPNPTNMSRQALSAEVSLAHSSPSSCMLAEMLQSRLLRRKVSAAETEVVMSHGELSTRVQRPGHGWGQVEGEKGREAQEAESETLRGGENEGASLANKRKRHHFRVISVRPSRIADVAAHCSNLCAYHRDSDIFLNARTMSKSG